MRYRKKPVVVDARQWYAGAQSSTRRNLIEWMRAHECQATFDSAANQIRVPTLEGMHRASVGDWIIRGVKGEFYPCKPDIFALTYEPVDAAPLPAQGKDGGT